MTGARHLEEGCRAPTTSKEGMMKQLITKAGYVLRQPPVSMLLAWAVGIIAIGLGTSMVLNPRSFTSTNAFALAMGWWEYAPHLWGAAFVTAGAAIAIIVSRGKRKKATLPAFLLALLFGMIGALMIPSALAGGIPSGVWLYSGMAWICLITQLSCGADENEARSN